MNSRLFIQWTLVGAVTSPWAAATGQPDVSDNAVRTDARASVEGWSHSMATAALQNCPVSLAPEYGVGDDPRSMAIADLDGDGDGDLAVANRNSNDVSILLSSGSGVFTESATITWSATSTTPSPLASPAHAAGGSEHGPQSLLTSAKHPAAIICGAQARSLTTGLPECPGLGSRTSRGNLPVNVQWRSG